MKLISVKKSWNYSTQSNNSQVLPSRNLYKKWKLSLVCFDMKDPWIVIIDKVSIATIESLWPEFFACMEHRFFSWMADRMSIFTLLEGGNLQNWIVVVGKWKRELDIVKRQLRKIIWSWISQYLQIFTKYFHSVHHNLKERLVIKWHYFIAA